MLNSTVPAADGQCSLTLDTKGLVRALLVAPESGPSCTGLSSHTSRLCGAQVAMRAPGLSSSLKEKKEHTLRETILLAQQSGYKL